MKTYHGSYTGNGADDREIYVAGMDDTARHLIMIVGSVAVSSAWRFADQAGDVSSEMGDQVAEQANLIQAIGNDGNPYFQVGTDLEANNNGTVYQYIVIEDDGTADVFYGTYTGDGNDNRNYTDVGMGFTPELVFVKSAGASPGRMSITGLGDNSLYLNNAGGGVANGIQSLIANGFQLGTSATVNSNGVTYYYAAFDQVAGYCGVGTYVGDGNDPRSPAITGVGFRPDWLVVKGDRASYPQMHSHDLGDATDATSPYAGAVVTNTIESLDADGFGLGSDIDVNANGTDYYYFAFLVGSTVPPVTTPAPTTAVPTTVGPTTLAPTTPAPTTVAPTTLPPTTAAPTTLAPTTLAPTTVAPTTLAPTTLAPTTVVPTTIAPTTLAPTTVAPTTVAPTTIAPTTIAPTTVAPTTVVPTTVAPTTVAPTTPSPTTVAPTTIAPTTVAPTTVGPTTIGPTTVAPTTLAPTTAVPTTSAPTTLPPTVLPTTFGPTTFPPIPEVRRRGISNFGFSMRDKWR